MRPITKDAADKLQCPIMTMGVSKINGCTCLTTECMAWEYTATRLKAHVPTGAIPRAENIEKLGECLLIPDMSEEI